jgi:hypothetical protein
MLRRREVLAAASLPLDRHRPLRSGIPRSGRLAFRLMREGDPIGTHVLRFSAAAGGFDIGISVHIAVRFGPFVLFRYDLRGVERWRGGVCADVAARTNDDGAPAFMRAQRDARGLWVTGSRTVRYLAPADALPATHWNEAELCGPWINVQDGRLLRPRVASRGVDRVPLADGQHVPAHRFVVSGDARLQLWYGARAMWTALLFAAKDGSLVRYERM